MLYDFMMSSIGFIYAVFAVWCYRRGFRDGKGSPAVQEVKRPFFAKAGSAKISEQDRRYNTILNNIDAYDGTDVGQKEVK